MAEVYTSTCEYLCTMSTHEYLQVLVSIFRCALTLEIFMSAFLQVPATLTQVPLTTKSILVLLHIFLSTDTCKYLYICFMLRLPFSFLLYWTVGVSLRLSSSRLTLRPWECHFVG